MSEQLTFDVDDYGYGLNEIYEPEQDEAFNEYKRDLDQKRETLKLQKHLDYFSDDPKALKRIKKREKQRRADWAKRSAPVGYSAIPMHEAMQQFPDVFDAIEARSPHNLMPIEKTMQKLQEHKRKLGMNDKGDAPNV